jgi:hypothetical protein
MVLAELPDSVSALIGLLAVTLIAAVVTLNLTTGGACLTILLQLGLLNRLDNTLLLNGELAIHLICSRIGDFVRSGRCSFIRCNSAGSAAIEGIPLMLVKHWYLPMVGHPKNGPPEYGNSYRVCIVSGRTTKLKREAIYHMAELPVQPVNLTTSTLGAILVDLLSTNPRQHSVVRDDYLVGAQDSEAREKLLRTTKIALDRNETYRFGLVHRAPDRHRIELCHRQCADQVKVLYTRMSRSAATYWDTLKPTVCAVGVAVESRSGLARVRELLESAAARPQQRGKSHYMSIAKSRVGNHTRTAPNSRLCANNLDLTGFISRKTNVGTGDIKSRCQECGQARIFVRVMLKEPLKIDEIRLKYPP